jgi:putative endonuclease
MRRFYVYILKCCDGSYYVGVTVNLERRLKKHLAAGDTYVGKRQPFELVYRKEFDRPRKAIAFEKRLKGWSREKKEALIVGDIEKLKELSQCRNKTHYLVREKDCNSEG